MQGLPVLPLLYYNNIFFLDTILSIHFYIWLKKNVLDGISCYFEEIYLFLPFNFRLLEFSGFKFILKKISKKTHCLIKYYTWRLFWCNNSLNITVFYSSFIKYINAFFYFCIILNKLIKYRVWNSLDFFFYLKFYIHNMCIYHHCKMKENYLNTSVGSN